MTLRSRLIALAFTALVTVTLVGCGGDEIKDPKVPADTPTLKQQTPGGVPGAPGGGAGKPGQGNQ